MNCGLRLSALLAVLAALLAISASARAEDAYYSVPLSKLAFRHGELPNGNDIRWRYWDKYRAMQPYAFIAGRAAESYVVPGDGQPVDNQVWNRQAAGNQRLVVRLNSPVTELTGTVFVPRDDVSGMDGLPFKVLPDPFKVDRKQFLHGKLQYYRALQDRNIPGSAWYRFQVRSVSSELGETPADANPVLRQTDMQDTFALFTGGRAVSENLQLDRVMPAGRAGAADPASQETIKLDDLTGISVQEMDWTELNKGLKPELDPLASVIPVDQHAVFFPSFSAAITAFDRAQQLGSLALIGAESRSEDAMSQQRYERQLCLPMTTLGRLLGPQLIGSMAITGSDPYLRVGSDIAVIFEARNPDALSKLLSAQVVLAQQTLKDTKSVSGEIDGIAYSGAVSPDRSICTYRAVAGNAVVVANSLVQLRQIIAASKGTSPSLATAPEYTFFRDRYKRGDSDETALLILSDATIRRWCGPRWRIADSRRTRAAAVISNIQAEHALELVNGTAKDATLTADSATMKLGDLKLTSRGATSSIYGSLDFMTPINELEITDVTKAEASTYVRWRNGYQLNWRQYFDPIACRISLKDSQIGLDLSVIPLIAGSDYRSFVEITSEAALKPGSGDPHDSAAAQLVVAVNPKASTLRGYGRFIQNISGNLRVEPLAWLGSCVTLYFDEDPFWADLAKADNTEDFLEKNFSRMPIALYAESSDPLRLAAFVALARGCIEQWAPNITKWENFQHDGKEYVKITADGLIHRNESLAIYYVTLPDALVVSLSEDVLQRAIDRKVAATQPSAGPATEPARPWLGKNIAFHISQDFVDGFQGVMNRNVAEMAQLQAWANIPILNEWKRQFPDKDPVDVHQKLFQSRLVDPAGGKYLWNEAWHTFESTAYGHPGEPRQGPALNGPWQHASGDFGLSFENNGLRAKAQIQQHPGK
ncbi:MAG TPA: hypothetical protein VH518_14495 [Tepidisphaeraceae bacterium]|jgi:hypothetical protein